VQIDVPIHPAEDAMIFTDQLASGWSQQGSGGVEVLPSVGAPVLVGSAAGAYHVEKAGSIPWRLTLAADEPQAFYEAVRFAFHPGTSEPGSGALLNLAVRPGTGVKLLGEGFVDLAQRQWQTVEIPLAAFASAGPVESLVFFGNFPGTFYLDDVSLQSGAPPRDTAVRVEQGGSQPDALALQQNFPNPFNAETVIGFQLAHEDQIDLAVYNLAGQRVVELAGGLQASGTYRLLWDGRDDGGRDLASGLYFYRLIAGNRVQTRKLLLLR